MRTTNPTNAQRFLPLSYPVLLILLLVLLSGCSPLRPAVNAYFAGDADKARAKAAKIKRADDRIGGAYITAMLDASETRQPIPLLAITDDLCDLQSELKALPLKKIHRLARFGIRPATIKQSNNNLRLRVFDLMTDGSTIEELVYLVDSVDCWSASQVDSLSREIVNRTLDSTRSVIGLPDGKWSSPAIDFPSEEQVLTEAGRSFLGLIPEASLGVTYRDATTIGERFVEQIDRSNYAAFWEIKREMFDLFQVHHLYCEMDRFKEEHPTNYYAPDCWYDNARDTLCGGELRPLLAFHRNNPHTALDYNICLQILFLELAGRERSALTVAEERQLDDIRLMLKLWNDLSECQLTYPPAEMRDKVADLAERYTYHKLVYDLAKKLLMYHIDNGQLAEARLGLEQLQPLYPDLKVCPASYSFQIGKQAWFGRFARMLDRAEAYQQDLAGIIKLPEPLLAFNTSTHDEHSLVSYGETEEVFFVRQSRTTGSATVMTARREGEEWTKPEKVRQLSAGKDIRLLSMNASGQQILLTVDGKLYQSFRPAVGRPWLKPDEVPMTDRFAGEAWLSPDDSLLLLTYFAEDVTPFYEPKRQLAVAQLDATGQYREAMPLKMPISDPLATNSNPSMALGGRLLFFSSDRSGTLGGMDTYSVSFAKPADWPRADSFLNLGLPLNTLSNDEGISYFSEYSGHAYFHRSGGCAESKDLYRYHLGAEVFPENALRLAGLVIDENGDPVGGGFMEFTPNFQLNVHARPISPKGTYTYTVADSTEVVRLFPEIPGYYSERDTTHYLAQVAKGEILRDTFRLISFDFIRKNFKLEHSTFFEGTARFNQPEKAYPEITRLAKIAVRMGADLELVGHTDRVGTPAENVALSLNRAQSVKNYLVDKCGFDPTRIRVTGKGDQAPICSNDTEEGRRCNRRIEIFFIMPELPE